MQHSQMLNFKGTLCQLKDQAIWKLLLPMSLDWEMYFPLDALRQ